MFADRLEEFRAAGPIQTGVNLLAHEDTALKAYFQTRTRYLRDIPQNRAFNQIGEALPTVMVQGAIVGTWQWDPASRHVRLLLLRGQVSPIVRRTARQRAEALTETLRQGWAPTHSSTRGPGWPLTHSFGTSRQPT
jgi:hypothetical protein